MKQIFKKSNQFAPVNQLTRMIGMLQDHVNTQQVVTPGVARTALSMESVSEAQSNALFMAANELSTSLEAIAGELGLETRITEAQLQAATVAGIMAGDYKSFLAHKVEFPTVSTESVGVVQAFGLEDSVNERSFAMEAYDERENRNAVIYSIAYNMQAARQDEFGETFFPTIVLTPDNVGFGVTVNLMMVYNGIERKISGTFEDFKKKNIIRAVADATVLRKEQTRIIPVNRAQSADKFVDPLLVAPSDYLLEGESIHTAPLAIGKKVDLLGLSQTDALLAKGIMDMTDSIDPAVTLQHVFVKFGDDVLKFSTANLPLSNFTYSTQNNYRVMTLNFQTTSVLVNKDTKQADGSALVDLAAVVTDDLILRLELQLSGSVNIETGETTVFGNIVSTHTVQDHTGNQLDMTTAPAAPVVAVVNAGVIFGYDLQAYRTNMNRRQQGQLIDTTRYTQLYNVPLRSPITAIHPINADAQTDASDVQALITATRIRTSNESVTNLLNAATMLRQYIDARDLTGVGPDLLGVGRFFVRPTYHEEQIDMNDIVDSLTSHQRAEDMQSALVNKIRDYAYRMYRDSEYKAAADALAGGIAPTPVVIIGTDPVIARYLNVTGDLRTLGGEFDVRVVSTLDYRVAGKIFITFGVFDESRNVSPNPMNFGNLAWAPELVLTTNISRGGQISKETVVSPRFLFVCNLPILTVLEISNISDVVNRVPLLNHQI